MVGKKQRNLRREFLRSLRGKEITAIFHLGNKEESLKGFLEHYNSPNSGYFLVGEGFEVQIPINHVISDYQSKLNSSLRVNLNKMYNIKKSVLEELAA